MRLSTSSRSFCIATLLCTFFLVANISSGEFVFKYEFPASWDGVGPTITDLGGAGNDATNSGAVISANVPPGAPVGSQSINTSDGGIATQNTQLLNNNAIAAAGGFQMDVTFLWDGTNDDGSSVTIQKLIDYAGTEFLQIENLDLINGTADLRFGFNDEAGGPTTQIVANTWYEVTGFFSSQNNSVAGDGSLSGFANMTVNGTSLPNESVTKTDFGDSLDRPIAVGSFSAVPSVVELHGDIFAASVKFLPEPTSLFLALAALLAIMGIDRRR